MKFSYPKPITQASAKTFFKLLRNHGAAEHSKVENSDTFMPLHITTYGDHSEGGVRRRVVGLAHQYFENFELKFDPNVMFLVEEADGASLDNLKYTFKVTAIAIEQSPVNRVASYVDLDEDEKYTMVSFNPAGQRDLTSFANIFIRNIKHQQGI